VKQQLYIGTKSTKSNRFISGGSVNKKKLYFLRNQPFTLWTSLGLNQGPPDYEYDKMIFSDSLLY